MLLATFGFADCSYFRVSTAVLKCGQVASQSLHQENPYQTETSVPEIQDTEEKILVEVVCDCEYSLMGADPRCDTDQSAERSSVTGTDDAAHFCHQGRVLCKDICPPRLP